MKDFSITDIAFASFLVSEGQKIHNIIRKGRKVAWEFHMNDETMTQLEAKWPSSESAKFYSTYQTLKTHIKVPKNVSKAPSTQQ